jgi:hypothetical protein
MEKFLEKLHQRPRRQRVTIFVIAVSVSIMATGYLWIRSMAKIGDNISVYGNTENASANSYTEKADLPTIKKQFSNILSSGKQIYKKTGEQAKKLYVQYKEIESSANNNTNNSAPIETRDPGEVPLKDIFGDQATTPKQ